MFTDLYSNYLYQMQNNQSYICIFHGNKLRMVVYTALRTHMDHLIQDFLEWKQNISNAERFYLKFFS